MRAPPARSRRLRSASSLASASVAGIARSSRRASASQAKSAPRLSSGISARLRSRSRSASRARDCCRDESASKPGALPSPSSAFRLARSRLRPLSASRVRKPESASPSPGEGSRSCQRRRSALWLRVRKEALASQPGRRCMRQALAGSLTQLSSAAWTVLRRAASCWSTRSRRRGRFSLRQSGAWSTRAIQSIARFDSSSPTPEPRSTSSTRPVRGLLEKVALRARISRRSRSLICS